MVLDYILAVLRLVLGSFHCRQIAILAKWFACHNSVRSCPRQRWFLTILCAFCKTLNAFNTPSEYTLGLRAMAAMDNFKAGNILRTVPLKRADPRTDQFRLGKRGGGHHTHFHTHFYIWADFCVDERAGVRVYTPVWTFDDTFLNRLSP